MSFGIEFDTDDEYIDALVSHSVASPDDAVRGTASDAGENVSLSQPSSAVSRVGGSGGADVPELPSAGPGHVPVSRGDGRHYDGLFALTTRLRREDLTAWMRRYAGLQVSGGQGSVQAVPDGRNDADEDVSWDERAEQADLGAFDGTEDVHVDTTPVMSATAGADGGAAPVGMEETDADVRDDGDRDATPVSLVLSRSALVLALLALLCAVIPGVGRVMWVLPAVIAVLVALAAVVASLRCGRRPLMAAAAVAIALASPLASSAAWHAYEGMGVISEGDPAGDAG